MQIIGAIGHYTQANYLDGGTNHLRISYFGKDKHESFAFLFPCPVNELQCDYVSVIVFLYSGKLPKSWISFWIRLQVLYDLLRRLPDRNIKKQESQFGWDLH